MLLNEFCAPPDHLRRHILAMRNRKSNQATKLSRHGIQVFAPTFSESNTGRAIATLEDQCQSIEVLEDMCIFEAVASDNESTACSTGTADESQDEQAEQDLHTESQPCYHIDKEISGARAPFFADGFSVTVTSVGGAEHKLDGLSWSVGIDQLCQRIGDECNMPVFAVRLLIDGELYTSASLGRLGEIGVEEGTEIALVQDLGWAAPDLSELERLQRKWSGSKCVPSRRTF